ncbi:GNAT family N-acetyltransferase [Vallitalea guaymasensis]|uniref:GNAT family N-acetyltransferase n=1 Tax=Vallitalea guaymasensis TaxID=1185412 RepID=A0A8J8M9U3_9FIRM|nr:GNAT family N-acetyltransferase [Vallitalea guaymasensis]QUH28770.1 GNAT family N-acetyltransferase [Vallitalea guaymasensis]
MKDFDVIWNIYCESFPENERRSLKQQMDIMKEDEYNLYPVKDNNIIVGFYTTWDLSDFVYIEHLAFDKNSRGKGHGSKTIKKIIDDSNKIILEVEEPNTQEAKKRIDFYTRLGFKLNNYNYVQPAYDKNKESVPLLIMSYPSQISDTEFNSIKDELYKKVYKVD